MSIITDKLLADFDSNHIIMVHPYMYKDKFFYNNLVKLYSDLNYIFLENKVQQTIILNHSSNYSDYYIRESDPLINVVLYECDDIWIRDYFPKISISGGNKIMIKYQYNAYGEKYSYHNDNNLKNVFDSYYDCIDLGDIVLEGGNLEFSPDGVLLANINSITNNNIRDETSQVKKKIFQIKERINIPEVYFIDVPPLCGDDTNGHIDNLVRFINRNTIIYFASKKKSYCNYKVACELEKQLENIVNKSKVIENMIPLYHDEIDVYVRGNKIYPYSKLNFIATKSAFIFPALKNNEDMLKLEIAKLPINVKTYIVNTETSLLENGGLHCLTANI